MTDLSTTTPLSAHATSTDGLASLHSDAFWQSTPRSTPPATLSLMAAVQQIPPISPTPSSPPKASKQVVHTTAARRPQCTHMTMSRLYGAYACLNCGKLPAIGWLYLCRQDFDFDLQRSGSTAHHPKAEPDMLSDGESSFDAQARVAESLGMSTSVVKGIRAGDYDGDQILKLVAQKKHLLHVLRQAEGPSRASSPPSPGPVTATAAASSVIASVGSTPFPPAQRATLGAIEPTPMISTPTSNRTNTSPDATASRPPLTTGKKSGKARKSSPCSFQVCHTCRPFFHDRLYISFEPVLNGSMPALTDKDIAHLPMLNPAIVRTLGLRQPRDSTPASLPSSPIVHSAEEDSGDVTTSQPHGEDYAYFYTSEGDSVGNDDNDKGGNKWTHHVSDNIALSPSSTSSAAAADDSDYSSSISSSSISCSTGYPSDDQDRPNETESIFDTAANHRTLRRSSAGIENHTPCIETLGSTLDPAIDHAVDPVAQTDVSGVGGHVGMQGLEKGLMNGELGRTGEVSRTGHGTPTTSGEVMRGDGDGGELYGLGILASGPRSTDNGLGILGVGDGNSASGFRRLNGSSSVGSRDSGANLVGGSVGGSSPGSEVEVAGGVALTEEAVEKGVPDIVREG